MPDHFDATSSSTIDRDNRLMAAAGIPMSQTLNDLYAQILAGNIGITSDARDVDSLALNGGSFGYDPSTTAALNFGLRSGRVVVGQTIKAVAASVTALAASNTNYVELDGTGAGSVSSNTAGFTVGRVPLYIVVTGVSAISTWTNVKTLLRASTPGVIPGVMLTTAAATKEISSQLGTISATTSFLIRTPSVAAVLAAVSLANSTAFATDNTNYWSIGLQNKGPAGTGVVDMLNTGAVNTTQVTGGSAITANVARVLTLNGTAGNLITAANDVLQLTLTKVGAPANLTLAEVGLDFSFTV
jgi:hypothetical protein